MLTFSWRGSLAWVVVGCAWKICAVLWLDLGICAAWVGGWMDGWDGAQREESWGKNKRRFLWLAVVIRQYLVVCVSSTKGRPPIPFLGGSGSSL